MSFPCCFLVCLRRGTWTESIFQPQEPGNIEGRSVTGVDSHYQLQLKVEESGRPCLKDLGNRQALKVSLRLGTKTGHMVA